MKTLKALNQFLSVVLRGMLVMSVSSIGSQVFAEIPAPTSESSFWGATAEKPAAAKPAAPAPAAPAPKPVEPAKTNVSAETIERLNVLEKKVSELSAMNEAAAKAPSGSNAPWMMGYKDGGGGFFMAAPDQSFALKFLGYVQANHLWADAGSARIKAAGAKPLPTNDFYLRRARFDVSATMYKNTELFMEFEGGVATTASAQSDFAMIEAKITHKIVDPFQLRFGKFLAPFSHENALRSSRALDTAERYAAINALVGSPAIESQQGMMVMGNWAKKRYDYALGVFNGNNKTSENFRDDNTQKELVGHFTWKPLAAKTGPMSAMSFGVGFDWDRSLAQTLKLSTLGGASLVSSAVKGNREGISPDIFVPIGKWLEIRGEGMFERFSDSRTDLYGGYAQVVWNIFKTEKGMGISPVVRAESAVLSESVTDSISRLNILTVGWNFYINKNMVWRMNYVPSYFRSTGTSASTMANRGHYDEVINQIQVKF